jgi:hypothetical protein
MNSRLRTCLLVSLGVVGWLAFVPAKAEAQNGYYARAAVNQYINGPYGGYGGYGYQPRYYGGYGNAYSYGSTAYGNGFNYGGNNWNGYQNSYPAFGYNSAYGGYSGYPAYNYGNRGLYYGY